MRLIGDGSADGLLARANARSIVRAGMEELGLRAGQRVLAIIPDNTRSFEPAVVAEFLAACKDRGARCELLIANGTHAAMSEEKIDRFLDRTSAPGVYSGIPVFNHSTDPTGLMRLGTLDAQVMRDLSFGRLENPVEITVNRRIEDYDSLCIIGPVFPHEVVGMSGGWKYFFPGIAGVEVINQSHWLGALIGIRDIIGRTRTPVRAIIEKAGEMVLARKPVACLSLVVSHRDLHGLYFGDPVSSHRAASKLSRDVNILWTERRYRRIVAECPTKYDELWTGGKLAYKTQEVVEKGGEIVLYAPHLDTIAPQHPDVEKVGYHCLDYFLGQWDRFAAVEPSSLAHSTHVAGPGSFEDGLETLEARRILASQVTPERCRAINLVYMDPAQISFERGDSFGSTDDTLWLRQAGEQLFMCRDMRDAMEE